MFLSINIYKWLSKIYINYHYFILVCIDPILLNYEAILDFYYYTNYSYDAYFYIEI